MHETFIGQCTISMLFLNFLCDRRVADSFKSPAHVWGRLHMCGVACICVGSRSKLKMYREIPVNSYCIWNHLCGASLADPAQLAMRCSYCRSSTCLFPIPRNSPLDPRRYPSALIQSKTLTDWDIKCNPIFYTKDVALAFFNRIRFIFQRVYARLIHQIKSFFLY